MPTVSGCEKACQIYDALRGFKRRLIQTCVCVTALRKRSSATVKKNEA